MQIFSGIQPTGLIHLGNYFGAIQHWVKLQENYSSLFCVVDQHAITSLFNNSIEGNSLSSELSICTERTAATLLACGVQKVFIQSHIPEHSSLMWVFSCLSPMNWFKRMTQYKIRKKEQDGASLGLFAYPALMAADILLYKAQKVPVGDDETEHLEIARLIATRFNSLFEPFFPIPEALHTKSKRIMSLKDSSVKMSKSSPSVNARVNLLDSSDEVFLKILKSKTDSIGTIELDEERPEIMNLIRIFGEASGMSEEEIVEKNWIDTHHFKCELAESVIEMIRPIREKTEEILKEGIREIIKPATEEARYIAKLNIEEIYKLIGFFS